MKIYLFKTYTIDPMINSWNEWYPRIQVLGLFTNSMFIIRLIYFIKGYSSFSGGGKIIRYSITGVDEYGC
jgi:hypothetical protein